MDAACYACPFAVQLQSSRRFAPVSRSRHRRGTARHRTAGCGHAAGNAAGSRGALGSSTSLTARPTMAAAKPLPQNHLTTTCLPMLLRPFVTSLDETWRGATGPGTASTAKQKGRRPRPAAKRAEPCRSPNLWPYGLRALPRPAPPGQPPAQTPNLVEQRARSAAPPRHDHVPATQHHHYDGDHSSCASIRRERGRGCPRGLSVAVPAVPAESVSDALSLSLPCRPSCRPHALHWPGPSRL